MSDRALSSSFVASRGLRECLHLFASSLEKTSTIPPAMSVHDLPEELLEQILSLSFESPAWNVHTYFSDASDSLRTSIRSRKTHLLLVSRTWYRISAPMLYSAVILPSPNHIQAVANVLTRHPELGQAIRALWLEPGFPKELYDIVKRAPNIEYLCLNLNLDVRDKINGLRDSLPLLNPTTVCLSGLGTRWDKAARLETAIAGCIRERWRSLVRTSTSYLLSR